MIIIPSGNSATFTLAANNHLTVTSRGGTTVTGPGGLLGTIDGTRTFGGYSVDTIITIAAVGNDCEYGVIEPDAAMLSTDANNNTVLVGADGVGVIKNNETIGQLERWDADTGTYVVIGAAHKTILMNCIKSDCTPNGPNSATLQYRGGWAASTAYAADDYIILSNGLRIVCATDGTSGATIPSALSPTGTTLVKGSVTANLVTDGTVEWYTPDPTMDMLSIAVGTIGSSTKFMAVGQNGGVMGGAGVRWGQNLTVPITLTQTLRRTHYGNAWMIVGDSNGTNGGVATLASGTLITDQSTTVGYGNAALYGVASKSVSATDSLYMAVGAGNDGAGHAKIVKGTFNSSGWNFTTGGNGVSSPATLPSGNYKAIAYMANVGKWIAVGDDGAGAGVIYVSADDGVTWVQKQVAEYNVSTFTPSAYNSIYYDSTTGVAMLVGQESHGKAIIVSTSDANTFTTKASGVTGVGQNPSSSNWESIHFDVAGYDGIWVSTGGLNHIWVSYDGGVSWYLSAGADAGYLGAINEIATHAVAVSKYDSDMGHRWVIGSALISLRTKYHGTRAIASPALLR